MGNSLSQLIPNPRSVVPPRLAQSIQDYIEDRWDFYEIGDLEADDLHELLLKANFDDDVQKKFLNTLVNLRAKCTTTAWTIRFLDPANQPQKLYISPVLGPVVSIRDLIFDFHLRPL